MSELTRVEHINLQPAELTTSVEIAVGAKGERKPVVKASIKRYFKDGESIINPLNTDLNALQDKVESEINKIMEGVG